MKLEDLFGHHKETLRVPDGWATAATVSEEAAFRAPFNLTVEAVRLIPNTAIVGNATNNATVRARNKGQAGTGTTVVASKAFDTPGDDDVAAFDEAPVDLAVALADRDAEEGDVIAVEKTVAGTGMAIDGLIEIEYRSRGI